MASNNKMPTDLKETISKFVNVDDIEKKPSSSVSKSSPVESHDDLIPEFDDKNFSTDTSNFDDDVKDYLGVAPNVRSAYDINLAEFPIAHLSTKLPSGVSKREIKYVDKIKGKNGEIHDRTWKIEGKSKYGLGGPSMLRLIYEIFQIWKDQGFEDKKIHIGTYHYLLKRMKKGTGGKDYKQLIKDLECIKGLDIKAYNACYIPEEDTYLKYKNFQLFPKVEIYGTKAGPVDPEHDYLYIIADDEFFQSVKQQTIYHMPLSIDLVDNLKPQELKLALYLAKIFNYSVKVPRTEWHRNIYELADQIPINVKVVETKKKDGTVIKRKDRNSLLTVLRRICKSLRENEEFPFLSEFKVKKDIISFYCNQTKLNLIAEQSSKSRKSREHIEYLVDQMIKVCKDKENLNWYYKVAIYVPDSIIYPSLSEAKHEGKKPAALFAHIIMKRGSEFFEKGKKKDTKKVKIKKDEEYYMPNDLYDELNRATGLKDALMEYTESSKKK